MNNKDIKVITGESISQQIKDINRLKEELRLGVKITGRINSELLDETLNKYSELINDIEFVLEKKGDNDEQ